MRFNRFNLLLVATAIITSMSGCTGSQKRTTQQEKESATMATTTVNTKNKNFYGTYEGTLPCADCSGIRTTQKINSDTIYQLWSEYLGKKNGVFEEISICNMLSENILEMVVPSFGEKNFYKILDDAVALPDSLGTLNNSELTDILYFEKSIKDIA